MVQIVALLTDDSRDIIYDPNMFIAQATDVLDVYEAISLTRW